MFLISTRPLCGICSLCSYACSCIFGVPFNSAPRFPHQAHWCRVFHSGVFSRRQNRSARATEPCLTDVKPRPQKRGLYVMVIFCLSVRLFVFHPNACYFAMARLLSRPQQHHGCPRFFPLEKLHPGEICASGGGLLVAPINTPNLFGTNLVKMQITRPVSAANYC